MSENETEKPETPKLKKIPSLDQNEALIQFLINLPEKTFDKLRTVAYDKKVSRVSIVRTALDEYFEKLEKPLKANPKAIISDEGLNEIINFCTQFFGGFEIDGENGFIEAMKAKNFKLRDLTSEQWERVKEKLSIGHEGYIDPPEPEEFAEKFDVLKLSKDQRKWFSASEETENPNLSLEEVLAVVGINAEVWKILSDSVQKRVQDAVIKGQVDLAKGLVAGAKATMEIEDIEVASE